MKLIKRGLLVAALSVAGIGASTAAASAWTGSGFLTVSEHVPSTCSIDVSGTTGSFDAATGNGSMTITALSSGSCVSMFNLGAHSFEGTNEDWDVALDGGAGAATITKPGGDVKFREYMGTAFGYCGWQTSSLDLEWHHISGGSGTIVFDNEALVWDSTQDTGYCGVIAGAYVAGSLDITGL